MDFQPIDSVLGDSLASGDIICESNEYRQLRSFIGDDGDTIGFDAYNLSTGDEEEFIVHPNDVYAIYEVY
jgi:hypothetical protein